MEMTMQLIEKKKAMLQSELFEFAFHSLQATVRAGDLV